MYHPEKFAEHDRRYMFRFIQEHPFATFVMNGDRLLATHIPVLTKGDAEDFLLFGHVATHNPQRQFLEDGKEALLIFKGADSYVSSSWYHERDISTWDYSAVHVNVKLKIQTRDELEHSLKELVEHFEKEQEKPLYYKDYPRDMVQEHLPQITGFWCKIEKMEAIAKLHQNYGKEDVQSVIEHLENKTDPSAKEVARQLRKKHFSE